MRLAILLGSDRQLGAFERLAGALCRNGLQVHLAVQGETLKDREGALGRLCSAHLSLTAGQAPSRRDRWSSLLKELTDRLDPLLEGEDEDDEDAAVRDRGRAASAALARLALAGLPLDPDVEAYLGQLDLDLLLIAPRADPWSSRLDYLIACRRLGLRCAVLAPAEGGAGLAPFCSPCAEPIRIPADADETGPEPILAAIERAASGTPRPTAGAWAARPLLELAVAARAMKGFAEERLGADVRRGVVPGLVARGGEVVQNAYARWVFPGVLRALLALLPARRGLLRDLLGEQLNGGEMDRLGWVEDALAEACRGDAPILLGPWVGGVGHEILYWIPMLRWLRKTYGIDKNRIVVISRGGVKSWYTGVIGHYLDLFDLAPLKRQEYRDEALQRITTVSTPPTAAKIEKEIYNEAARVIGAERFRTLHPQVMFKLFKRRWTGVAGTSFLDRYTRAQSIRPDFAAAAKRLGALPDDYVAVNFHFGEALPDTPRSRDLVTRFVLDLAERTDVYLIEPPGQDAATSGIEPHPRIHRIPPEVRPSEILGVQSGVIGGARAFIGSAGPMTYVGQALGLFTVAVRAGEAGLSESARELTMIDPDPQGGTIHMVGLDDLERLLPALTGARGGASGLSGAVAAAVVAPAIGARTLAAALGPTDG